MQIWEVNVTGRRNELGLSGGLVGVGDEMGPGPLEHMGSLSSFFMPHLLSAVPGTVWEARASLDTINFILRGWLCGQTSLSL